MRVLLVFRSVPCDEEPCEMPPCGIYAIVCAKMCLIDGCITAHTWVLNPPAPAKQKHTMPKGMVCFCFLTAVDGGIRRGSGSELTVRWTVKSRD